MVLDTLIEFPFKEHFKWCAHGVWILALLVSFLFHPPCCHDRQRMLMPQGTQRQLRLHRSYRRRSATSGGLMRAGRGSLLGPRWKTGDDATWDLASAPAASLIPASGH